MTLSLSEKRCLFTSLLAELIVWANRRGIRLALGEGYVALTDAADGDHDGPHKAGGAHYTGLGVDLLMYRPTAFGLEYVADGGDPTWTMLGAEWERMHSFCRWGGRFSNIDPNHFSLEHEGRA